jgi:hypothetical protein
MSQLVDDGDAWLLANDVVVVVVVASCYIHDGAVVFQIEAIVHFWFQQESVVVEADGRDQSGHGRIG